jgi:hypothetical protein
MLFAYAVNSDAKYTKNTAELQFFVTYSIDPLSLLVKVSNTGVQGSGQ